MHYFAKELQAARTIARRAGDIAMRYYRGGIAFDNKDDASPVTLADRECEQYIVAALASAFPGDGVLGEEGAHCNGGSGRRWIVDPIDGTRDFVRGLPSWTVLVALEAHGEVVVGVSNMAAFGELFSASRGLGAFVNDAPIEVSGATRVEEAVLCVNAFFGPDGVADCPFASGLLEWMKPLWAVRSMGGALDAMMVARGQADLWIETRGKPWDFAAPKIIIEEAGGRFFNFDGGSSIYGGNCVMCAPGLEAEARRFVVR